MKPVVTLWHNPRCSKSRQALALLEAANVDVKVRRYLEDPPSAAEIGDLLVKLGLRARDIVRSGEAVFAERGLADAEDDALIEAMSRDPILIERPIAIGARRAVIGRPPERVTTPLDM